MNSPLPLTLAAVSATVMLAGILTAAYDEITVTPPIPVKVTVKRPYKASLIGSNINAVTWTVVETNWSDTVIDYKVVETEDPRVKGAVTLQFVPARTNQTGTIHTNTYAAMDWLGTNHTILLDSAPMVSHGITAVLSRQVP